MAERRVYIKVKVDVNNDNVDNITQEMLVDILDCMNGSFNVGDFEVETEMEYQDFDEDDEDD